VIDVCLVDDQTLVREGIKGLLSLVDDVRVVGEASDGAEGLDLIAAHAPDVVLLDLRMPRVNGIELLRRLHEDPPTDVPAVLVLTTFDDDELVVDALRAGARGYLLKDVTLEELAEAIRRLAAGGTVIRPAITAGLLARIGPTDSVAASGPGALTERERDVLGLVAAGLPNREIAAALHLSEGTIKNHVSSILMKLGVRDRTQAVLRALELELLT
jgi:DNA-binding NarL/FixJ family response regulator